MNISFRLNGQTAQTAADPQTSLLFALIQDGGVNGVKLTWEEGETQYEVERGVEVYERLKKHPGIATWNPLSVGIAYALIDRVTADKVPLAILLVWLRS